MTLLFLSILTLYLEKIATQSSLHNCDSEISVPVFRSSKTKAVWADEERAEASQRVPCVEAGILSPLAETIFGPKMTSCLSCKNKESLLVMKFPVAPESKIAYRL